MGTSAADLDASASRFRDSRVPAGRPTPERPARSPASRDASVFVPAFPVVYGSPEARGHAKRSIRRSRRIVMLPLIPGL